eukprot:COSAG06_NODE_2248_length_7242_cov_2.199356_4_plen_143_part_00
MELSALLEIMREQADHAEAKMDALRKAQDAKLERQRQEIEQLRAEIAARPPLAIDMIDEQQLAVLQTRLQSMHGAQLLKDEELFAVEDVVSDFIEIRMQVGIVTQEIASANPVAGAMKHLVGLSEALASDAAFGRQLRRKFL